MLRGEGIDAFVDGGHLVDEFAVSQRLMNRLGARIMVPAEQLARAREVMAALGSVDAADLAAQATAMADPQKAAGGPPRGPGHARLLPYVWAAIASVLAVVLGMLWLRARGDFAAVTRQPLFLNEPTRSGLRLLWKDTGKVAAEYDDLDHDGVFEATRLYDRAGRLLQELIDADQNGVPESVRHLAVDGSEAGHMTDGDQDGRAELDTLCLPDGSQLQWRDVNGAGRYEECVVQDKSGAVMQHFRLVAGQGLVEAK